MSTITSTMSPFRIRVAAPEAYDGKGDFGDWFRRLLSYLSLVER